ncbi:GntR family transcriptional regulator [Conexibacter woesei]|uniref:GntR family transcriptional regulator n=1 Tax=Conexibacter woesei TaxID=191495 RepID=UPI0003F908E1|nr:GntR family transcriptional regulator [Conexibacter woesei]
MTIARPDAYTALRAEILSGALQPSERLVETELAQRFGVGRAAVRTALARLTQEGLVEHERNRGARVRLVGESEAAEILEARAVLEGLAARHAARHATPEDIDELRAVLADMRDRLDAGDLLGASDRNAVLHSRLLALAHHGTVDRLVAVLKGQLVRFQYRTILVPGRSERSFGEHTAIVDAIAAGDPDAAEAAMRRHLGHVAEALREAQRNSASTAAAPNPTDS